MTHRGIQGNLNSVSQLFDHSCQVTLIVPLARVTVADPSRDSVIRCIGEFPGASEVERE